MDGLMRVKKQIVSTAVMVNEAWAMTDMRGNKYLNEFL